MTWESSTIVLLANAAATWFLVGLIWFVQIVHYPLFGNVSNSFTTYHAAHVGVTTWVVAPAMLIELGTAAILACFAPPLAFISRLGLFLVVVIWLSTALLQVPRHDLLALGFDAVAYRELILTNWLRTAAWTLRGLLVIYLLHQAISQRNAPVTLCKCRN